MAEEKGNDKQYNILINGAGTVGSRLYDVLESMAGEYNFKFFLCKYDAKTENDKLDIRTRELLDLLTSYQTRNEPELYAAPGDNLGGRIKRLKEAGLPCKGSIEDLNFSDMDVIIDCSNIAGRNKDDLYSSHPDVPILYNGGAVKEFKNMPIVCGINGTVYNADRERIHASCNTTRFTTSLIIMREVLGAQGITGFEDQIRHISLVYDRRIDDPHVRIKKKGQLIRKLDKVDQEVFRTLDDGDLWQLFGSTEDKDYHLKELQNLVPETTGKFSSVVSTWPTRYFHNAKIEFHFHAPIAKKVVEQYREALRASDRVIYTDERKLDHKEVFRAAHFMGIPDGDLPVHVEYATAPDDFIVRSTGTTPMKGIVAIPTAATVLVTLGLAKDLAEAQGKVHEYARFKGIPLQETVSSTQYNLKNPEKAKRIYEKKMRKPKQVTSE